MLYEDVQIPGLISNLAPQPAAYFMERDIGSITVHRGPGQASAIGSATFGGYVDLASPNLSSTAIATAYGTLGGYSTRLYGIEGRKGSFGALGGGRGLIDLSGKDARGATSNTDTLRRNGFLKFEQVFLDLSRQRRPKPWQRPYSSDPTLSPFLNNYRSTPVTVQPYAEFA